MLKTKLETTYALIGLVPFIKLNRNHGMTSHNARKVFQKDESELFSKRNKTVLLMFLDNRKRYDM